MLPFERNLGWFIVINMSSGYIYELFQIFKYLRKSSIFIGTMENILNKKLNIIFSQINKFNIIFNKHVHSRIGNDKDKECRALL